jgi:choline dehydrogenase-like flavoprotein
MRQSPPSPEFDYVIVGAGSAGCVLANRLSADPSVSVALLEDGPPDDSRLIKMPAAVGALLRHPILNWNLKTTPQPYLANRARHSRFPETIERRR